MDIGNVHISAELVVLLLLVALSIYKRLVPPKQLAKVEGVANEVIGFYLLAAGGLRDAVREARELVGKIGEATQPAVPEPAPPEPEQPTEG